jgi:hypothetical protein
MPGFSCAKLDKLQTARQHTSELVFNNVRCLLTILRQGSGAKVWAGFWRAVLATGDRHHAVGDGRLPYIRPQQFGQSIGEPN